MTSSINVIVTFHGSTKNKLISLGIPLDSKSDLPIQDNGESSCLSRRDLTDNSQ